MDTTLDPEWILKKFAAPPTIVNPPNLQLLAELHDRLLNFDKPIEREDALCLWRMCNAAFHALEQSQKDIHDLRRTMVQTMLVNHGFNMRTQI